MTGAGRERPVIRYSRKSSAISTGLFLTSIAKSAVPA
jgi:hypothetical protein